MIVSNNKDLNQELCMTTSLNDLKEIIFYKALNDQKEHPEKEEFEFKIDFYFVNKDNESEKFKLNDLTLVYNTLKNSLEIKEITEINSNYSIKNN